MVVVLTTAYPVLAQTEYPGKSVARQWNEQLLSAIRLDEARPTVHARNLFHISVAMWDAWAAFDDHARGMIHMEKMKAEDVARARHEAISYAAFRLLDWRFKNSPNVAQTRTSVTRKMAALGYDINFTDRSGDNPAALGNRIAHSVIQYGMVDGANEQNGYSNQHYQPVNPGVDPRATGNPDVIDPDRWQPLYLPDFVGQSGIRSDGYPPFVGPEWGEVKPFSLTEADMISYNRDGHRYRVYLDAGPPPLLSGDEQSRQRFKAGFEQVIEWSGKLDPNDRILIDISPESRGNNTLGTNDGSGHRANPATGKPYQPQLVPEGDYYRVLAEFWADGPSSETPPGHWFTILNVVADHPALVRTFGGAGPVLDPLEWDVRAYFTLGGAMHDAAVAAWSNKGWYDYTRPISAIRYLCDQGQSSNPELPGYARNGIRLKPGVIELISEQTIVPDGRHHHLAGENNENLGKVAVKAWRGPSHVPDPDQDTAGVGWILCGDWWPYQRPNFVTPPFAGYVSGHSTYSRAAAEVLTLITGSRFFPGGMGIFKVPRDTYLVFEKGPSMPMNLQWATYQDAADECSLSRIYGGIHPPGDDIPGRLMGYRTGHQAYKKAVAYFP
jgi:hypothetical protein